MDLKKPFKKPTCFCYMTCSKGSYKENSTKTVPIHMTNLLNFVMIS